MSSPKEFHIDAVYPEPLSRLRRTPQAGGGKADFSPASYRRAVKKQLHRGASSGRFRTQPVTFQEIQEVDEENVAEVVEAKKETIGSAGTIYNKSETDLKAKFELFYRSICNDNSSNNNNNSTSSNNNSRSTPVPCSTKSPQIDPSILGHPSGALMGSSRHHHLVRSSVNSPSSSNSTDHHPPLAFNSKSRPSI